MKKLLLSMRVMLLVAVVCAIAMPARADVTVNVLAPSGTWIGYKTSSWDASSATWEELTATTYIGNMRYYTKTLSGNDIYFAFSRNNVSTYAIHGTSGTVNYVYDGYNTAYGTVPSSVKYDPVSNAASNTYYFFYPNTAGIANPQAYVWNGSSNNDWNKNNGSTATVVGQDGAGNDIYKFVVTGINFTPTNVIFHNGENKSAEFACSANNPNGDGVAVKGGYYSDYNSAGNESFCVNGCLVNDLSNLSSALQSAAAEYIDNGYITTTTITRLDLSNKSLSDITGIEKFPGLRYLDASKNSISFMKLNNNTKLQYLDVGENVNLRGFSSTTASSSQHFINLNTGGTPLYYLRADGCTNWGNFVALKNTYNVTSLEYLSLKNLKANGGTGFMGWSTAIEAQPNLKYLDMEGSLGGESPVVTNLINLETLIVSNNYGASGNRLSTVTGLANLSNLKYFDMSGCDATPASIVGTFSSTQKGVLEYLDLSNSHMTATGADPALNGFTALETFKFGSQSAWTKTLSIQNCPALANVDVAGNAAMTGMTVSNCPALEEIDFTSDAAITTLTLTNNGYNNSTQPMPTLTGLSASNAVVDLSDNEFTAVPGTALTGVSVKTLKLNNNKVASISGLENLGSLTYLYLQNQTIPANTSLTYTGHSVPQRIELSNNPNFTSIDLSGNQLKTVFLKDCSGLKTLNVSGNLLNTTAGNYNNTNWTSTSDYCLYVGGCTSLESLDASNNDISTFGMNGAVDDLTNLETLNLANNDFSSFGVGTILSALTSLKTLNLSGNKIYSIASSTSYSNLQALTNLESVDLSNNTSGTGTSAQAFHLFETSGLANLKTVTLTGNFDDANSTHSISITGSPLLETVNVTGETALGTIDLSSNGLSSPVTITGWTTADAVLKYNDNDFTAIPTNNISANVSYLYLLRNEFQPQLSFNGSDITYKGVALSNKSGVSPITSFTATATEESPNTTLEAINLDGNTSMTDLTVNYFDGLTQTASDADMTTAAGKGLYIKGLSALENIDISHNAHFEKFGQNGSTTGLSAVKTLDASHNALYTFSNKTAIPDTKINGTSVANGRPAHATFSTLEDLTALETLNLSNNQLCDSVHLWKNRNLKRLDVSNNRTITARAAGSKRVYCKGDGTTAEWATMVADRYTGDLNDTIGVRMLDLFWNQQLEYIDISNTAIQNTAMDHTYMNNFVGPGTPEANAKPEKVPHFILVNRCKNLKEFHADNNGMKSLGIGSSPKDQAHYNGGTYNYPGWVTGCPLLEVVSVKGARGQDPNIMKGELNISANNPNVWYYDASDGGFDYIGTANGAKLKYLNVSGNYNSTNQYTYNSSDKKWHCTVNGEDYTTGGNPFQLNVNVNSKLETLMAQDCPKLQVIVAENLDNLTSVDLTQNASSDINQVYIDHNSSLPGVTGLETLTELHTLWVNDDPAMAGLDVTANTKLERLHAQNNPQFGVTDTKLTLPATSSYLKTLWVSNDNLGDLNSDKDLNVSGYAALDSLLCDNNRLLYLSKGDNLATNTALRHLNCDNNLIADLSLAGASQLEKVNANDNDLFKLDVSGNHPNLVELKFANNHVNGIALAGATSLTQANYDDTNNGRQITANHQRFYTDKPNQGGVEKDLYYFQLVNGDEGTYGKWVSNETSTDSENHENVTRVLGVDGFDASKWASATVSRPNQVAATADDVNANKVYGTIAVLTPTSESSTQASGRANYEYNNGNSAITSNFYLDWTANPTVFTGIDDVPATGGGVVVAGQGALIVNGAVAGQVLGIYDLQGREVRREVLAEGVNEISLPAGIYIVNGQKVMIR